MENAVYTFEQLFSPSHQADSAKVATTIEKVKLRVLKVNAKLLCSKILCSAF